MCTGRFVRFFCPEAIAANPLCPHFDPVCQGMTAYAQLWVQTKFVCCGRHYGDCVECPLLHQPGNVEYLDGSAAECPKCSARLRTERAGMVAAEREDAYMADSEGDEGDEGGEGDFEGDSEGVSESSGASRVSDSENVEMTDANVESVVDEDNMHAESGIVCGCEDCAEFDIVCGCEDCMKEQ